MLGRQSNRRATSPIQEEMSVEKPPSLLFFLYQAPSRGLVGKWGITKKCVLRDGRGPGSLAWCRSGWPEPTPRSGGRGSQQ